MNETSQSHAASAPPPAAGPAPAGTAPLPEPPALEPETVERFPGYRVTAVLERDAACTRYAAVDQRLDRKVTVLELRPHPARRREAVERFFEKARATAGLRHEHLVRNLDVGRTGDGFYLVTERTAGETLAAKLERLERGRVPEREAARIVAAAARALQAVFEASLVHGRVCPANILLGQDGRVRLLELGFARELAWPDDRTFAREHPDHAAPEQLAGEEDVDIRADLYALGCTWFHALLGRPPFRASTPEETARLHLEAARPVPREIDERLGAASSQGILRLLEREREERPRTPAQFLRKLAAHPLLQDEEPPEATAT